MADERRPDQDDEDSFEEEEEDNIERVTERDTEIEEEVKRFVAIADRHEEIEYVKGRLGQLFDAKDSISDLGVDIEYLKHNRSIYRVGLLVTVLATATLGAYTLVQHSANRNLRDDLTQIDQRVTSLDSLANERGVSKVEHLISKLRQDSTYWHDELDSSIVRGIEINNQLREDLRATNETINALSTTPQRAGYSKTELTRRVNTAQTQGRASGYEQGLQAGRAKALEQIFSRVSAQARALEYRVTRRAGSIEYTVATRNPSLDNYSLTEDVLRGGLDEEERISALRERLLGLGVKKEDVNSYLEGSAIGSIVLTIHPITREVTGIHTKGLDGQAVGSYRPIRTVEE